MKVQYFVFFSLLLLFGACAQQGSPSGGPRDETPPAVVESDPPNYSTRFDTKKILITFDEYIVLDNVNQQLIVSPPMDEKPEVKLRKKTLIIEFVDTLKINTTYTFNFGDAIKDLHEGNKLQNFEYVFSTGDVLDSLSVRGTLKYSENLEAPDEPFSIMLYDDLRDSVPLLDIPLYVGRSDDSGVFSVNNLRADVYKVFALKDANNNFLFDLPSEEIAFLDSSLILNPETIRLILGEAEIDSSALLSDTTSPILPDTTSLALPDTISLILSDTTRLAMADTTGMGGDSIPDPGPDLRAIYIDLMLFTEAQEIQYITDYSREDRRNLLMVFALPLSDSFSYRPLLEAGEIPPSFLEYFSPERDTLSLWVRDSLHYKKDSLYMELKYTVRDTLNLPVVQTDTMLFSFREKSTKKKRGTEGKAPVEQLEISTIGRNGSQDLNRDLSLNLNFPLESINDSLISLYHIPDSVDVPVSFESRKDSLLLTRGWLSSTWIQASKYRLELLPGAITSIYPPTHDTIIVSFTSRDSEYYGKILLGLSQVKDRVIVQLISGDKVVMEKLAEEDGEIVFPFLAPKDYQLKFIHDRNGNGKWDTGNYMKKLQPESVEFWPEKITVRSNWDHDVSMTLEK